MKLRPTLLTLVMVLGCSETNYGDLGRTSGAGAGTTGAGAGTTGAGAGTTGAGAGTSGAGAGTSGAGAGTTGAGAGTTSSSNTSSGAGGAPGSSSSSGSGGSPGSSSGGTGGNPYNTPPTCSSMTMAVAGNNGNMKPGSACRSCHVLGGAASGKTFDVAGTVYLTAHEPDDCNGVNVSGAVVIITDANNAETQLPVNAVGNFYHYDLFGFGALPPPLHARVQYNGNTRKMLTPITNGDCDSCHTETGTMLAPGRIMLP